MKLRGATIPQEIAARVVARRGRAHGFADIEPKKTALVVIDLQNAFMPETNGKPLPEVIDPRLAIEPVPAQTA